MNGYNIMRQALGDQWQELPGALQAHYQDEDNRDIGSLDIEYPTWMQLFLNFLHVIGALLNRRGENIPTIVTKSMEGDKQRWHRTITFDDGKKVYFKSHWQYIGQNKLVEYVNSIFGLCMSVEVKDKKLHYHGEYFVLKIGKLRIPIPEWLMLGHTTIIEHSTDDKHFTMDFKLRHPVFGQIYRYTGTFTTVGG